MSHRKAKTAPKQFESDHKKLKKIVINTMAKASQIVGSSMGPGGKLTAIESDFPGLPNKVTKDGVTILKSLGAVDAYEHLILEIARDCAQKTALEAGDGTTTATVLAHAIISNLFDFCENNPKQSPQRVVRRISTVVKEVLVPYIQSRSISIGEENKELLKMVATISANGDKEMADAVIKAFEEIGFGDSSHVTIRELSGPPGYKVERIDGFPVPIGYEETSGKLHTSFINDQGNQRCYLENPLFILFDGQVTDLVKFENLLGIINQKYTEGESDYKNIVIVAHSFSENVLLSLAVNFSNPATMNVVPLTTPMNQFANSQLHFLHDLAAFTGAKVFGLKDQISTATVEHLGSKMQSIEIYRFRTTVVGDPDPINVEVRAEEIKQMMKTPEGQAERIFLEERLGKITNGIAKLTIYGGSGGELKEAHDRCEDAVCAVRSAITHGALPGGCRVIIDMTLKLSRELEDGDAAKEVLMASLLELPNRLLENAGYPYEEIKEIIEKLVTSPELLYDIENMTFGKAEELGLFDATKAVQEAIVNAVSIAGVLGTLGGIVCHPRDDVFERTEAKADSDFNRAVSNPYAVVNEANERS